MYKLTVIGPLPDAGQKIDLRLAWLILSFDRMDDFDELDPKAFNLSPADLGRLARTTFVYDPEDEAAARDRFAPVELSTEVWRAVSEYEGRYQVSNLGRVRSLDRVVKHRGTGKMQVRGRVLKPSWKDGDPDAGHPSLMLSKENAQRRHYVSRLVLATFERPPREGEIARFRNGDSSDTRLVNLRWGTRSEIVRPAPPATNDHDPKPRPKAD